MENVQDTWNINVESKKLIRNYKRTAQQNAYVKRTIKEKKQVWKRYILTEMDKASSDNMNLRNKIKREIRATKSKRETFGYLNNGFENDNKDIWIKVGCNKGNGSRE